MPGEPTSHFMARSDVRQTQSVVMTNFDETILIVGAIVWDTALASDVPLSPLSSRGGGHLLG